MSPLEITFWKVLGYLALPGIFIIGFIIVAVFAAVLLAVTKDKEIN
ncbi:TIGR02808 family protein [Vibrio sp. SS-MA-C1-2]|nr:TIGR02808 family protein [Vibrio sp. SS-MA-C1-2]UJF16917.1 TIGR02808 family protein [Vibrio sp. SS-MA-C1-2]